MIYEPGLSYITQERHFQDAVSTPSLNSLLPFSLSDLRLESSNYQQIVLGWNLYLVALCAITARDTNYLPIKLKQYSFRPNVYVNNYEVVKRNYISVDA